MLSQANNLRSFIEKNKANLPQHLEDDVRKALDEALADGELTTSELFNLVTMIFVKSFSNLSMSEIFQIVGYLMKGQLNKALTALFEGLIDED